MTRRARLWITGATTSDRGRAQHLAPAPACRSSHPAPGRRHERQRPSRHGGDGIAFLDELAAQLRARGWSAYITTPAGRLAFLFDTQRVKPSGLACELVVWVETGSRVAAGALNRQFARTPYAVSFVSSGQTFILVTLHIDYGKQPGDRIPELKEIASWLADWAEREYGWDQNLIALGDFNIDREDDPLYQAFTSTGLTPAPPTHRAAANDIRQAGYAALLRPDRLVYEGPEEASRAQP